MFTVMFQRLTQCWSVNTDWINKMRCWDCSIYSHLETASKQYDLSENPLWMRNFDSGTSGWGWGVCMWDRGDWQIEEKDLSYLLTNFFLSCVFIKNIAFKLYNVKSCWLILDFVLKSGISSLKANFYYKRPEIVMDQALMHLLHEDQILRSLQFCPPFVHAIQ